MSTDDENLPDVKPWFDNESEDEYSDDLENGFPYDNGAKVQE